jgi:hypothetical protein
MSFSLSKIHRNKKENMHTDLRKRAQLSLHAEKMAEYVRKCQRDHQEDQDLEGG